MSDLNALDLESGQIVGGYTLVSRVGGGAMGSVWRVHDDGGQIYAMKILRESLNDDETGVEGAEDDEFGPGSLGDGGDGTSSGNSSSRNPHVTARERLRREAMSLQRVRHPGVCSIVDMELDDSLAFIVTELIEGRNLRDDVAANGKYEGVDLERLARKLIDAVHAVHAQGIVHRDIKPTNVMVSATGPVLVDFGIAMAEGESHVTRTGLVMGTPGFIAPEIIDGAESCEATDWWSLASVLAFAATGQPVFGVKPMMAVLEREAAGNANLAGLPPHTLAAFRKALSPDPSKRCSPEELLNAIISDSMNPLAGIGADLPFDGAVPGAPPGSALDRLADLSRTTGMPTGVVPLHGVQSASSATQSPSPEPSDTKNLRKLWSAEDDGTMPAFAAPPAPASAPTVVVPKVAHADRFAQTPPTVCLGDGAAATMALPAPPPSPSPAASAMVPESGESTALMPAATRVMPHAPAADPRAFSNSTTVLQQAVAPPVQQQYAAPSYGTPAPPYGTPEPPVYAQPASIEPQLEPTLGPALEPEPTYPAQQYAAQPYSPYAAQPPAPSPEQLEMDAEAFARSRRAVLTKRSRLPIWLLALALAALAAFLPQAAYVAMAAFIWLFVTLGLSEDAQIRREYKRGGARKKTDSAKRIASLPWHVLKGLALSVPGALLAWLIAAVIPAAASLLFGLPTGEYELAIGSWNLALPYAYSPSLSPSTLLLAGCAALAWCAVAFGPKSDKLRLGAGYMRRLLTRRAGNDGHASSGAAAQHSAAFV